MSSDNGAANSRLNFDPTFDPTCACIYFNGQGLVAYSDKDANDNRPLKVFSLTTVYEQTVPDAYLFSFPGMAVFKNKLYVAHLSAGYDNKVYYSTYDGTNWTPETAVPHVYLNWAPAMAAFQPKPDAPEKLYLAHQGSDSTGATHTLWYTTFDGANWTPDVNIPHVLMNASPAMAVYKGTLYLAHQGSDVTDAAGTLWYTTFDGSTWTKDINIPHVSMTGSPSMAVYDGELYVAYQYPGYNPDSEGPTWAVKYDGEKWSLPFCISPWGLTTYPGASPSLLTMPGSNSLVLLSSDSNAQPTTYAVYGTGH